MKEIVFDSILMTSLDELNLEITNREDWQRIYHINRSIITLKNEGFLNNSLVTKLNFELSIKIIHSLKGKVDPSKAKFVIPNKIQIHD